ncbi:MMPL family transporter [Kribbella sp. NPDC050124]|uniref:MMPL family transporter n=1 Tax=Kribbella sp. NPDC050124 TaxID=3364114 RepID=UPI0037AFEA48
MTEKMARLCARRPWLVVGVWLVVVVTAVVVVVSFLAFEGETEITRSTESKDADRVLTEGFPRDVANGQATSEVVVVRADAGEVEAAGTRARVAALADELRAVGASRVVTYSEDRSLVSQDGDSTAILLAFGPDGEDEVEDVVAAVQRLDDEAGYQAAVTGGWIADADEDTASLEDLKKGELFFGAPLALVVLLLVFGTVVAGLVPLMVAVASIVVALALVALLAQAYDLSVFTQNMLIGMGLALGIDYSLFTLSRYREERRRERTEREAIATAGATAGRAVLFSGIAFVLAMLGLLLVPSTIFRSLAAGAIIVGIVSVIAALTLLPAVLALLGDRVNALRIPFFGRAAAQAGREGRFWGAIVHRVMRRPAASLLLAAGLLLTLAAPVLALDTGTSGAATLPDRFESKQGYLLFREEFPKESTEPVDIAVVGDVRGSAAQAGLGRLEQELARRPLFGEPVVVANGAGTVAHVTVPIADNPDGERAIEAVRDLRTEVVPRAFAGVDARVYVGGDTAEELDYQDTVNLWLPLVLLFVLGLSFLLLTLAFRSIVVPATAIAMNLLSVGAAYGLLVLVFQEGVGNELLGLGAAETIDAWVPLFLFAVVFGLSMDYQVFLLSRIRERYTATGDTDAAIAFGIGSTARLITGAALIIVAVFWGFAMGDTIAFQQMGFGIAVALLIDATIVRSVLVPATMKLLGERNWYLPRWLTWLPDVRVESPEPAPPPTPAPSEHL